MGQRACSKRHVVDCGACRHHGFKHLNSAPVPLYSTLTHQPKLLESIFDQSTHYIGIFDLEGRIISCNGKLQGLLYRHGESLLRPIWQHKGWEDSAVEHIQNYFSESVPQTRQFNAEIWHPELGAIVLECQFKPLPTREESQILLEAQDITWRKLPKINSFSVKPAFAIITISSQ